jgi:hypothetical protein
VQAQCSGRSASGTCNLPGDRQLHQYTSIDDRLASKD